MTAALVSPLGVPADAKRFRVGGGEVFAFPCPLPGVVARLSRPGRKLYFMSDLYVPPAERNQGNAHRLIKQVLGFAVRCDLDVWTYATPFEVLAPEHCTVPGCGVRGLLNLYKAHGFKVVKNSYYRNELLWQDPM